MYSKLSNPNTAYKSTGNENNPNFSEGEARGDFAPFSHDAATVPGAPVPEPSTWLLMALGLLALGGAKLRRNSSK